ncbi:conserved protein of unknown function [Burkholderia multivorans]
MDTTTYITGISEVRERTHGSTDEVAELLLVLPQTVLKAYSRDGEYCGIRPIRLPNRRLAWPMAEVKKLLSGESEAKNQEAE